MFLDFSFVIFKFSVLWVTSIAVEWIYAILSFSHFYSSFSRLSHHAFVSADLLMLLFNKKVERACGDRYFKFEE